MPNTGMSGMSFDPSFLFTNQFNKINSFRGMPEMSEIKDINCCIKIDIPTIQEEAVFNIEYPRNLFCSNCNGKGGEKKTESLNGLQINKLFWKRFYCRT